MRIAVLTAGRSFDTGLAAVLDTFAVANFVAASTSSRPPPFDVRVTGVRRLAHTGHGFSRAIARASADDPPDVAVVPALDALTPPALETALARRDVLETGALLQAWAAKRSLIAAACTGTFVVAEAGLLDGGPATTTWWLGPFFRQRYPRVRLDESRMIVEAPRRVTAGAALAHVDLALWIVGQRSTRLASLTSRYLVSDPRLSQAPFKVPEQLAQADPVMARFERWARTHLAQGFSLAAAARGAGASERTLSRRAQAALGKSPLAYFQDLRVERAVQLLQTTEASVDEIAGHVGYADGVTLRALLRRHVGRGVREIRQVPRWLRASRPAGRG